MARSRKEREQIEAAIQKEREQIQEVVCSLERLAAGRGPRRGRPPAWIKKHTQKRGTPGSDGEAPAEGFAGVPSKLPPHLPQHPPMSVKLPLPD
jgi:hypothetical protein